MFSQPPQIPDEALLDLSRKRVCVIVNMGSGRKAGGDIASRLKQVLE